MESSPSSRLTRMNTESPEKHLNWLALVASSGTLICCALPIALVTLGLGAAVAALSSSVPFLVTLTAHKGWVFAGSAALLTVAGWFNWRPGRTCPADAEQGDLCRRNQSLNRRIFWVSVVIWTVGFFTAYLALPIQIWIDN